MTSLTSPRNRGEDGRGATRGFEVATAGARRYWQSVATPCWQAVVSVHEAQRTIWLPTMK